ncbi:MAG: DUF5615 family PIN-like protein [Nitrospirae bacterium]|nr:DUF5615 family PIN-like protein [Nitrospirota bacterium]
MDFLANENFPLVSVKLLRNAGHNVASIIEDTPCAKDEDVLKRAHDKSLIILTLLKSYTMQCCI